ncbi:MAG TPA: DUF1924 domain-containing protein [Gammaproteobacteria bacterium]
MQHRKMMKMIPLLALLAVPLAHADTVDDLLKGYQAQGAGPFSAEKGKAMWSEQHASTEGGAARSCAACHGENLTSTGKHAKTGKAIEPMAPSANPQRFTDAAKVEKWFKRNCTWTVGRECTPQEKGDFLSYLRKQ